MNRVVIWIGRFLPYRDLVRLLVRKDLVKKYRRSFLGYLWSMLDPLFTMLVMTGVFSLMFKNSIENFPVYMLIGNIIFGFVRTSTTQAMSSIMGNAALIKKTDVPKYLFTLATVTSKLVDLLFALGALFLVMLFTGVRVTPYILFMPLVLVEVYAFALGLGLFLAQFAIFYRDMYHIYGVITTAWMYMTPIFYPLDRLPAFMQAIIKYGNPLYCYVHSMRRIILNGWMPDWSLWLYGLAVAAVMLMVGMASFLRTQNDFILYI